MREITSHRVNPANDKLRILVVDEPGSGGAHHEYRIVVQLTEPLPGKILGDDVMHIPAGGPPGPKFVDRALTLSFQNGPIATTGVNGVTHEALLAVLIDRLECFQAGPYNCEENMQALHHLKEAAAALKSRTLARMARGVEGTHQV